MSEKDTQKDWAAWRENTEKSLKDQGDKLDSLSSQTKAILEKLSNPEPKKTEKHEEDLASFGEFLGDHVESCPECQETLKKAGYVKISKKSEPEPTPEPKKDEPKRWSVSNLGRGEE